MDLNQLLSQHQIALINGRPEVAQDVRRFAAASAAFYAERIAQARAALGRSAPFTWGDGARRAPSPAVALAASPTGDCHELV